MFFNVRTVFTTLRKISTGRNNLFNLIKCNNNNSFQLSPNSSNRRTSYNKIVISLGLIPFLPKIAAESEPNISKLDKPRIEDSKITVLEKPKEIEKTGWERLCDMYKFE